MMRKTATWVRPLGFLIAVIVIGGFALTGCGEQDLYKPPNSPYQVVGRLPLVSNAQGVAILGNTVYVAGGQAGLIIVDISDPTNPFVKGVIDTKKFAESVEVASLPFRDTVIDIAFVVEGTEGITTYNVTNPDSAFSFAQGTTAVDGNGLFVSIPNDPSEAYIVYLAENWKGMRIFESDPNIPGLLRYNGVFTSTRGYAKSVAVVGGYAYLADDELGVAVVDVRERVLGTVKVVSFCDTPGYAHGIAVGEGYAFVADGLNGLVTMAINGAEPPVTIGHLLLGGDCKKIEYRDEKVFIAAEDSGLHIVSVSDPANPVLLGTVVSSYANGVATSPEGIVVVSDRDEGLILFAGGGAFQDKTAPGRVADLSAATADSSGIRLSWHAPGDDVFNGTASQYDVRYATSPITEETWEGAAQATGEPAPLRSGALETMRVGGLLVATRYHFALRTADEAENWSSLSNVASASTASGNVEPVLSVGSVSPDAGLPEETFVYSVTYTDAEGDPPSRSDVVIDGDPFAMSLVSGDFATGAVYQYQTTLAVGAHDYYFAFDDGRDHPVETPVTAGPFVGESFEMGSPIAETGRDFDEAPHTVVLTRDIEVAPYEVTQSEYEALMGTNPSKHVGPNRPVENLTWFNAAEYCNALSLQDGLTPAYTIDGETVLWNQETDGWRLPTEAEWERACRAGTNSAFANGDLTLETCVDTLGLPDPTLDAVGWFCGNAGIAHHEVGLKQANTEGLYDMHGNVYEWCWDWYVEDLGTATVLDPIGPPGGSQRVIRGGSWFHFARECRSAERGPYWPNSGDDIVGFRVVRTIQR